MAKADNSRHIHYYHRHFGFSYPTSFWQRLYSVLMSPLIFIAVLILVLKLFPAIPGAATHAVSVAYLIRALAATFFRLLAAYILALIFSVPLALLVNHSPFVERLLLPLFDIVQSVPVLAFFPVVVLFFVNYHFLNGAAIFIIFLSMLWNIVFSLVGGLKVIPNDIKSAAYVFNVRGFDFVRRILLPAAVPYLVTGSLLAWAQGWNIIIVAEVLHTYIPGGAPNQDLFGIGSVLVNAAASGQNLIFFGAVLTMTSAIAFLNFFVWQKLLRYAEQYKFE
jgi:NitT/TauT family transport system permease protein